MSYPVLFPKTPKDAAAKRRDFREYAKAYEWISDHTCPKCNLTYELYCDVTHVRERCKEVVPGRLEEDHAQGHNSTFIAFDYLSAGERVEFRVSPLSR
jgi:hypothetical protein